MVRGIFAALILSVFALGCSQGHCRRKQEAPKAAAPLEAPPEPASKAAANNNPGRVLVYKYDGSLQCGKGKPVPVDVMAKELSGIQIFSSVKKPDGMMHIQVCGSITGMTNVYEINAKDLKKAEAKGFQKWSFE